MNSHKPHVEAFVVFAGIAAAVKGLKLIFAGPHEWIYQSVAPALFLAVPAFVLLSRKTDPAVFTGLTKNKILQGIKVGLVCAVVILPLFVVGYWVFHGLILGRKIHFHIGPNVGMIFLRQFFVVAFPEEFLFRGYIQGRLDQRWNSGKSVFGGKVGPALIVAAALFALGHFITKPMLFRFGTFFPALLFGWIKERSGSVAGPILFHALANVTIFILEGSV